ncbi:MAG: Asp-tRNA(Asn)/Glu-tRNA(Gln) amidotransferase subunit GatB, partial [Clostridiales bacterium]|nr:Asp-tRNA(Asn)/Glu-tRNA(Gln) amidotransferase subunit GatB [Clostridiales bacterium]
LIEIVSEPDFRSAEEVVDYLERLKTTLQYIGVSDCKMQEGSMRADINLSVRPAGETKLGTRTEMKNMASIKAISRAIEAESKRQIERIEAGKTIRQQTRRWDDDKGVSYSMRSKEDAHDYKYFPEPDLLPLHVSREMIDEIAREIPELRETRKERYIRELGLPEYDADILTGSYPLVRIFERTAEICGNPKEASNWIMTDLLKLLKEAQCEPEDIDFSEDALGTIIAMVAKGTINRSVGRKVLSEVFAENVDPAGYIEKHGLAMVADRGVIEEAVARVIDENTKAVDDHLAGNPKSVQFLIGQSMKLLRGKADPNVVRTVLFELLEKRR